LTLKEFLPYAQVGSTIAAAVGLFINGWQFWRSRKTTTLQQIQDFFKAMNEREAALGLAENDHAKEHALVEFLNFLEVYSAAVNVGLFMGVARELVCDKIIDSIVVIDGAPTWHGKIEKSITSNVTYKHISKFMRSHKRTIHARTVAAIQAENIPLA
jgi:hypothetical protein